MKILIADDDSFFRNFYSTKLKEYGFVIETAVDGEDTLKKLKSFRPDLLFLDIIMPNIDGFSVLEQLKKDTDLKNIPIIVFSTLGQEEDIKKANHLGVNYYINKSYFDFPNMLKKINEVLKK